MSNIYLKVTIETFSKLRFSGFKKFVIRSVFAELQRSHISLNFEVSTCNLKIRGLGAKLMWFFYINFKRNDGVLKSQCSSILLKKKNFNKNEMESKMGNPTHTFRETNLALQLI